MSLPQGRSTAEQVFYTWVARSRSGSSSFTASALNKPSSSSSSSSSSASLLLLARSRSESSSQFTALAYNSSSSSSSPYAGPVRPAAALCDRVLCLFVRVISSSAHLHLHAGVLLQRLIPGSRACVRRFTRSRGGPCLHRHVPSPSVPAACTWYYRERERERDSMRERESECVCVC